MQLFIQELHNPWEKLKESPASEVLSLFENNPVGRFEQMDFDYSEKWLAYDSHTASKELEDNSDAKLGVRTNKPYYFDGGINRHRLQNTTTLNFDDAYLLNNANLLERIRVYLKEWRFVLPSFHWSVATIADDRSNEFWYEELELEPLPDCFGSRLGWYYVISPLGYKNYFKRDDLLKTPAFKVEELNDGTIAILSYEHPQDIDRDETTKRIVEITNYLNSCRLD